MILVTGGLGFIGIHTVAALRAEGGPVLAGQRRPSDAPWTVRLDCTQLASLLAVGSAYPITGIVHLAGGDSVPSSVQALANVVQAAVRWGVARVVTASTIGVYGGIQGPVYREDVPLPVHSGHLIPAMKKAAEIIADQVSEVEVVSARIGAIWGPGGRAASPFFGAPQMVHAAVAGAPLPAPLPADDAIDMLYARDCGRALAVLQTAAVLRHRTYNIGSGRATTNREVAAAVRRIVHDARVELAEGGGPGAYLDIERLRADTGFTPRYDLEAGVADYVAWLRAGNAQ